MIQLGWKNTQPLHQPLILVVDIVPRKWINVNNPLSLPSQKKMLRDARLQSLRDAIVLSDLSPLIVMANVTEGDSSSSQSSPQFSFYYHNFYVETMLNPNEAVGGCAECPH